MRIMYPVTAAEIGSAATRQSTYGCTIAVRAHYTSADGLTSGPLLSYGSPLAYEYTHHDGLTYAVPRGGMLGVDYELRATP
jgi:hypothetical protein